MAVGDLYQLKLKYVIPNMGDFALNVFQYVQTEGTATLEEMRDGWDDTIGLAIRTIQSNAVVWSGQEITNLFDLDEFLQFDYPVGTVHGVISQESAPPSDAVDFTLQRSSRAVRNGSKRFGGLPVGYIINGVFTNPDFISDLNELGVLLSTPFTSDGDGATYEPVIVKRVKTANPDYPDHSKYPFIYSMPTSSAGAVMPVVAGYKFSTFVSSQVSRKANR